MFGGSHFSFMAPASKRALEREEAAKTKFREALEVFNNKKDNCTEHGRIYTVSPLLTPDIHLTSQTYGTFHRWVKENHPNWRCKRREATAAECKEHAVYNRGKSYFVDAIYEQPDPVKKKRLAHAAEKRLAKKVKLQARRDPSTIFGKLGTEMQFAVLSFIKNDGNRLRALLKTPFKAVAERDELWESRLKSFLEVKFDNAFVADSPAIVSLSKRPNWRQSTEFRVWYNESMAVEEPVLDSVRANTVELANTFIASNNDNVIPEKLKWLLQDVSLCEYYLQVKAFADEGEQEMLELICEDTGRCQSCLQKWHSCRC